MRIKFRAVEVVRVLKVPSNKGQASFRREEFRECTSERRLFFPDGCFQHPTALKLIRILEEHSLTPQPPLPNKFRQRGSRRGEGLPCPLRISPLSSEE